MFRMWKKTLLSLLLATALGFVSCEGSDGSSADGSAPTPAATKSLDAPPAATPSPNASAPEAPVAPPLPVENTSIILRTERVTGLPYVVGETFSVDVAIRGVREPAIQAYGFALHYDSTLLSLEWPLQSGDLADAPPEALRAPPPPPRSLRASLPPVQYYITGTSPFDNSRLDLSLCRLTFRTVSQPLQPIEIALSPAPDFELLIDRSFHPRPARIDHSATFPLPGFQSMAVTPPAPVREAEQAP